jgi:hypothetical protein
VVVEGSVEREAFGREEMMVILNLGEVVSRKPLTIELCRGYQFRHRWQCLQFWIWFLSASTVWESWSNKFQRADDGGSSSDLNRGDTYEDMPDKQIRSEERGGKRSS